MKFEITQRDKKLLKFLAVIVILAVFLVAVFMPLMDKNSELDMQLTDAENEKADMEQQIAMLPSSQTVNEKSQKDWEELSADFYPIMTGQAVSKLITDTVIGCGLEAESMNIALNPEPSSLLPFQKEEEQQTEASETENAESTEPETQSEETPDTEKDTSDIMVTTVGMTVAGDMANLQLLIDKFATQYPSIRTVSYSFDTGSYPSQDGTKILERVSLSMELEVYMCEK